MAIQVLASAKKDHAKWCGLFWQKLGLERAAPVRTLMQKLRAGEQFLARGKVHGSLAAVGTTVDSDPL